MLKKGDIYVAWNQKSGGGNAFKPLTWPERVEIKERIDYAPNLPAPKEGGAEEKKSFLQKGFNSNLEIPG